MKEMQRIEPTRPPGKENYATQNGHAASARPTRTQASMPSPLTDRSSGSNDVATLPADNEPS